MNRRKVSTCCCTSLLSGNLSFSLPNSANIIINLLLTLLFSSSDILLVFSSYCSYCAVFPHCSFAFASYSFIFFVSNTEKSIISTPVVRILRANSIRLSIRSLFIVRSSICCSSALSLSKLSALIILLMSFNENSSSLRAPYRHTACIPYQYVRSGSKARCYHSTEECVYSLRSFCSRHLLSSSDFPPARHIINYYAASESILF